MMDFYRVYYADNVNSTQFSAATVKQLEKMGLVQHETTVLYGQKDGPKQIYVHYYKRA
jgi:hypothetical protein